MRMLKQNHWVCMQKELDRFKSTCCLNACWDALHFETVLNILRKNVLVCVSRGSASIFARCILATFDAKYTKSAQSKPISMSQYCFKNLNTSNCDAELLTSSIQRGRFAPGESDSSSAEEPFIIAAVSVSNASYWHVLKEEKSRKRRIQHSKRTWCPKHTL